MSCKHVKLAILRTLPFVRHVDRSRHTRARRIHATRQRLESALLTSRAEPRLEEAGSVQLATWNDDDERATTLSSAHHKHAHVVHPIHTARRLPFACSSSATFDLKKHTVSEINIARFAKPCVRFPLQQHCYQ